MKEGIAISRTASGPGRRNHHYSGSWYSLPLDQFPLYHTRTSGRWGCRSVKTDFRILIRSSYHWASFSSNSDTSLSDARSFIQLPSKSLTRALTPKREQTISINTILSLTWKTRPHALVPAHPTRRLGSPRTLCERPYTFGESKSVKLLARMI